MKKFLASNEEGQVVLVILLILTVLLTIGLSVASRSATDIKISQQSQESARALWVAQAGLEQAIKANISISSPSSPGNINNVSYSVTKTELGGTPSFVFPDKVSADDSRTFWLVGHTSDGQIDESVKYAGDSLKVYWGVPGDNNTALEVTYVYKDNAGNFYNVRSAFDPNASRSPATSFTPAVSGGSVSGVNFSWNGTISITGNTPYLLKIKPLFNTAPIQIGLTDDGSDNNFPSQGSCFDASASIPESNVTRKLTECRYWQTTPSIFDYLLFSGQNL